MGNCTTAQLKAVVFLCVFFLPTIFLLGGGQGVGDDTAMDLLALLYLGE